MFISAIIPTLHRPEGLVEAVESIFAQTRVPDELVIIDQSQDLRSKQAVERVYAEREADKPVLVYVHDTGVKGLVQAKARGVAESSGDVISFLEDDVVLMPDYFECMEQGFTEKPDMLGCSGVMTDASTYTNFYRAMFHLFHRGIFYDPRIDLHGPNYEGERYVPSNYLSGGISAYRREVFERVAFDITNDFFMFEDIEFSTRAADEFGQDHFVVNTSMRLDHRYSPINRAKLGPRWQRKLREIICFYKKRKEKPFALICLLWLMVGYLIEAIAAALRLRNTGPLLGTVSGAIEGFRYRLMDAVPNRS